MRREVLSVLVILSTLAGCGGGSGGASGGEGSFGLLPIEESEYRSIPLALVPPGGSLPARADLSGDMPPVGAQGRQSSCVGWAVAYALRTYLERRQQQWDVSRADAQFSPAFVYNQAARGNCDGGMRFIDALNILTAQGAATMAAMPYTEADCAAQPSEEIRQQAQHYRIAQYRRLNVQDGFELKAHLAAGFPVLLSLETDDHFVNLDRGEVWSAKGRKAGYHAVVLVGYDDSAASYKVINSWGDDWGTDGYGWISYDLFPRVAREGYIVAPFEARANPNPEPGPQPGPEASTTPEPDPQPPGFEQGVEIVDVAHGAVASDGTQGMNVTLKYTLKGYAGHTGQIALHFWYAGNQPVRAVLPAYSDIYGFAAAGTEIFYIERDEYVDYEFVAFVPYAALNAPAGEYRSDGRRTAYYPRRTDYIMAADLFIDSFGIARSNTGTFYIVY